MEQHVEGSMLTRLERAELAARERRLMAEVEAERVLEAGAAEVREIEGRVPTEVATALAELRERHLRGARDELAAIEEELAELDGHPSGGRVEQVSGGAGINTVPSPAAPRIATGQFEAAVERVASAVLGEDPR